MIYKSRRPGARCFPHAMGSSTSGLGVTALRIKDAILTRSSTGMQCNNRLWATASEPFVPMQFNCMLW